jgi:preprotein translocase subunit SecG
MYTFIIGIIIFAAVLLVLIVLAQNSKGGGLSSQFGGSGASNIIGVKKTGDLLEKLTWGFVIAIMILSLSTNFVSKNAGAGANEILERAGEPAPPAAIPNFNNEGNESGEESTEDNAE